MSVQRLLSSLVNYAKKNRSTLLIVICAVVFTLVPSIFYLKYLNRKSTAKINRLERVLAAERKYKPREDLPNAGILPGLSPEKNLPIPQQIAYIPLADSNGIVEKVTTVNLDSVVAPYNGSMIEADDSTYHLFFRYDVPLPLINGKKREIPYHTFVGYTKLDENFQPIGKYQPLQLQTNYAEDPRIVKVGDQFYLIYNDMIREKPLYRTMRIAKWDPQTFKVEDSLDLDLCYKPIEKNWTPFDYFDGSRHQLHLVYTIAPHKTLYLPNPEKAHIEYSTFADMHRWRTLEWSMKWGYLSGGTPPRLVEGEYVSFFHSWFRNQGIVWYVMGAYTFEAQPPFRMTGISQFPILFTGLYDSEKIGTSSEDKYVIFPAGFTIEKKQDGQTLLHVSCGENDAAIKVVTINYQALKQSMVSPLEVSIENHSH